MQITELLEQMGGLQSVARELGVSESQVASGAQALLPAILGGFKNQAQAQPTGLEGLTDLLGRMGGGSLLDNVLADQPTDVNRGNDVLGQIFGSKEVSRTVADSAAGQTGLDSSLLRKMLPMLAMLVAGYMSRRAGAAEPGQAELDDGQDTSSGGSSGGSLGGILGQVLGGRSPGQVGGNRGAGGLASMLDFDGDGNPLNDILGMAGKLMRR